VPGGRSSPGRLFSNINHGRAQRTGSHFPVQLTIILIEWVSSRQTAPENAISTLNALVLFSVLSSECKPFRMPTITARMMISPAEQTANDMFEIRFLAREWKCPWSSCLKINWHQGGQRSHEKLAYVFSPVSTWRRDSWTSGRSCARPGNAAVQNVKEHYEVGLGKDGQYSVDQEMGQNTW